MILQLVVLPAARFSNAVRAATPSGARAVAARQPSPLRGIVPTDVTSPGRTAGHRAGRVDVSPDGALEYAHPLWVAPGQPGLTPSIALSYSSRAGNGLLGAGFSLGGTGSQITRCGKNSAADGFADSIRFDTSDWFCLDGKRLQAASGVYGHEGTEYRTQPETFARIVSHGQFVPLWFEVWSNDGLVHTYADRIEGRLYGSGERATYAWALSSVRDRFGNRLQVTYERTGDEDTVEFRPVRLDYGWAADAVRGTRQVVLAYENRPDVIHTWRSGLHLRETKRLASVTSSVTGVGTVRTYRLSYVGGTTLARSSRLGSIEECDATGVCLAPVTLSWSAPSLTYQSQVTSVAEGLKDLSVADFNGDGLDDLLHRDGSTLAVRFRVPGSSSFGSPFQTDLSSMHGRRIADIDGDGIAEFITDSNAGFKVHRWDDATDRFVVTSASPPRTWNSWRPSTFLDLDGDGMLDALRTEQAEPGIYTWHVQRNLDGAWGHLEDTGLIASDDWMPRGSHLDVDGDRREEGVILLQDGTARSVGFDESLTLAEEPLGLYQTWEERWQFLDVNGDGLQDALTAANGWPVLRINTGRGFGPPQDAVAPNEWYFPLPKRTHLRVVDINQDGLTDFVLFRPGTQSSPEDILHGAHAYISRGDGFVRMPFLPFTHAEDGDPIGIGTLDYGPDGQTDFLLAGSSGLTVLEGGQLPPHKLTGISVTGIGPLASVAYSDIVDPMVHTSGTTCGPRQICKRKGVVVVRSLARLNPAGYWNVQSYRYEDGRTDRRARTWLGFARAHVLDEASSSTRTIEMNHQTEVDGGFPYAGLIARDARVHPIGDGRARYTETLTSRELVRGSSEATYWARPYRTVSQIREGKVDAVFTAPVLKKVTVDRTHDAYGAVTLERRRTEAADGALVELVTQTRKVANDRTLWLLGLVTEETTNRCRGGCAALTSWTSYDPVSGAIATETSPSGRTTTLVRDVRGNPTSVVETVSGGDNRKQVIEYDADGIYPVGVINPLGHAVRAGVHPGLGVTLWSVDPNGRRTEWSYDGFGRLKGEYGADGSWRELRYSRTESAWVRVQALDASGGEVRQDFGTLGEIFAESWRGFDGHWVSAEREHDRFGRPIAETLPAVAGTAAAGTVTTTRDGLGRPTLVTFANGTTEGITYDGMTTTITDPLGMKSEVVADVLGATATRREPDPTGGWITTTYEHGPFGPTKVIGPLGHATVHEYDWLGRPEAVSEPDLGRTETTYDAWNRVESVTDALGVKVSYAYDALDRLTFTTGAEWLAQTWDAPGGTGALASASSSDGVKVSYEYVGGRPTAKKWTHPMLGSFETRVGYDAIGRLESLLYPEVPGRARFGVRYHYGLRGHLTMVSDSESGAPFWTQLSQSVRGQTTGALYGNGARATWSFDPKTGHLDREFVHSPVQGLVRDIQTLYDAAGAPSLVVDSVGGNEDSYTHDALGRLTRWEVVAGGQMTRTADYAYDALGNVTSVLDENEQTTFEYAHPTRPRTVTSRDGVALTTDARGRVLVDGERTFTWTGFDLPRAVAGPAGDTKFLYDPDGIRFAAFAPKSTTVSIGDLYQRRDDASGTTHVFSVFAGGGVIAQIERDELLASENVRFLHHDRLGSVVATTGEQGELVDVARYTPFGSRIEGASTSLPGLPVGGLGFTGHASEDELGLIDMGGRLYDPALLRFLTPDPIVSDPLSSQSYHPFSYVDNRPMAAVDPTGFQEEDPGALALASTVSVTLAGASIGDMSFGDALALRKSLIIVGQMGIMHGDTVVVVGERVHAEPGFIDAQQHVHNEYVWGHAGGAGRSWEKPTLGEQIAQADDELINEDLPALVEATIRRYEVMFGEWKDGKYGFNPQTGFGLGDALLESEISGAVETAKAIPAMVVTVYDESDRGNQVPLIKFGAVLLTAWVTKKIVPKAAAGVQANRAAGQAGESFLSQTYGGVSQVTRTTSLGVRVIDNLADGVARESKVGRAWATRTTRRQVAKDTALLNDPLSQVKAVEWHFFPSWTGVGPSGRLRLLLEEAGFGIVIH